MHIYQITCVICPHPPPPPPQPHPLQLPQKQRAFQAFPKTHFALSVIDRRGGIRTMPMAIFIAQVHPVFIHAVSGNNTTSPFFVPV